MGLPEQHEIILDDNRPMKFYFFQILSSFVMVKDGVENEIST